MVHEDHEEDTKPTIKCSGMRRRFFDICYIVRLGGKGPQGSVFDRQETHCRRQLFVTFLLAVYLFLHFLKKLKIFFVLLVFSSCIRLRRIFVELRFGNSWLYQLLLNDYSSPIIIRKRIFYSDRIRCSRRNDEV